MQAVVLTAPGLMEAASLRVPEPGPGQVLVRVAASGICGSDLAVYCGTHPYKKPPVVLGHELSGIVERVGPGVQRVAVGARVCAASFSHCERCPSCRQGRIQLCTSKRTLGHGGLIGSLAEFVLLEENMVFALPDSVDERAGALVEPLSVGLHCARVAARAGGHSMAVLGSGNIGLCVLVAARLLGFEVVCSDRRRSAGELALQLGATAFVGADGARTGSAVKAACSNGDGADVVVVAAGYPNVIDDALAVVRPGGTIVIVSYFDGPQLLPLNELVIGELTLATSALSDAADIEEVLRWLAAGAIDWPTMIGDTWPLHEAPAAMRKICSGEARAGKVLIQVREGPNGSCV